MPGLCKEGSLPLTVGRVGSAGGASSLGFWSSGFPIPLCMSASSIISMELSAVDRDDAIASARPHPRVSKYNPPSLLREEIVQAPADTKGRLSSDRLCN